MKKDLHENELDGLFRDHLAGEEATPRPRVWNNIEKQLDAIPKRPTNWIWWLSGVALVAGIGTWIGVSLYNSNGKNPIAQKTNVTGWNYNDPNDGGFGKVPTEGSSDGDSVVLIEGGQNTTGNTNSTDSKNNNSSIDNSSVKNSGTTNSSDNSSTTSTNPSLNSNSPLVSNVKKNNQKNPSPSDSKSNSPYADKSAFEKNDQPVYTNSSDVIDKNDSPDKRSMASADKKEVSASSHEGNTYRLPRKLSEYTKSAAHAGNSGNEPSAFGDNIPRNDFDAMRDNPRTWPDSASEKPVADDADSKKDSATPPDSSGAGPTLPPPTGNVFPAFYAALHGAVDAQKILQSSVGDEGFSKTDVRIYDKNKLNVPQQTYSYGVKFGWFLSKRISLTAGAYYSIYQSATSQGSFKFNHNYAYTFTMHSPTSSVICPSSKFDRNDGIGQQYSDTIAININSQERYDYVNLQLGVSYYLLRTKHFGLYGDLLSNGAILSKQEMTLMIPRSGKTLTYSGNQLSGMNKFVLGGQTGVGVEWTLTKNFGIWAEPSFFFSGAMNKNNAVRLQPGGMRYLAGVVYHF
jgi:hypothetical protein